MSSDIDEIGEEAESGGVSPSGFYSPNDEYGNGRQRNASGTSGRRCSLPSDRPSSAIRRHLQQFKTRRKISAPTNAGPPSVAPRSATTSPMESMSGYPLAELLERLRPAAATTTPNIASRQTSTDSVVTDPFSNDPPRQRRYSVDAHSYRTSCGSSSPGGARTVGSIDEGFHSGLEADGVKRPLFVDTRLANTSSGNGGPATVPWRCLYYRQSSVAGVADEAQHCQQRQRSNSEAGRYLLMRKYADHRRGSEFVGKLDDGEWAYCQILATLKCFDLMPPLAKMVVFDSNLPIRKAFLAFVHNNVRAAPIWDGHRKLFVGLLTVTDLMHMLLEYAGDCDSPTSPTGRKIKIGEKPNKTFEETLDLPLHTRTITAANCVQKRSDSPMHFFGNHHNQQQPYHLNHLIYALADETVANAAKLLCDRRLHRLLILDPDKGGNPLFLLSKKDVLKALRTYIAKLPLPPCMEKTLDELMIGTWSHLVTVTSKTTIHRALSLFLGKGVSSLPVVDGNFRIVDMLTKVDVMNLVIEHQGLIDSILQKSVQDAIGNRVGGLEKMTTCSKKATILLAVECILHSESHRLAIVDSEGRLEGVLSLTDFMRFLTSGFPCDYV